MPLGISLAGVEGAAVASAPLIQLAKGIAMDYSGILTGVLSISGKLRYARYGELAFDPNILPNPEAIIQAMIRGLITPQEAAIGLRSFGIVLGKDLDNEFLKTCNSLWKGVTKLSHPVIDIAQAFALHNRELITDEQLREIRKRNAEGDISLSFLRESQHGWLTPQEALSLNLRGEKDWDVTKKYLKNQGGYTDEDIDGMRSLTKFIPGIQDLITFTVRDVFNTKLVDKYKLSEEFENNEELQAWASSQGMGDVSITDANGVEHSMDVPLKYWQAHWQYPGVSSFYDMYHRLREGRTDRYTIDGVTPEAFTIKDLQDALKVVDYSPYWRLPLAAINSRQLTRVDIKRAYNINAIPREEVREQYLDLGYVADDATTLTKIADKAKEEYKIAEDKRRFGPYIEKSTRTATAAYKSGAISRAAFINALRGIYDDDDKIQLIARLVDMELDVERVKVYVGSVKREFMLGLYTRYDALTELKKAGVQEVAADRYLDIWIRLLRYPRRVASTQTIIDWYKRGLVDENDAESRLHNLGWSNEDILLWMQRADQEIPKIKAREEAARARTEKQKARAGCDVVSCSEKAHKETLAEFRRDYPIATIAKWFKASVINETEARQLLAGHELPQDAIDHYIDLWNKDKANG